MKHRIGYNRLGRNVSHRKALYRSMATALFRYERIKTSDASEMVFLELVERKETVKKKKKKPAEKQETKDT